MTSENARKNTLECDKAWDFRGA